MLLLDRNRPMEGEPLLRSTLEGFLQHFGRDHPHTLAALSDLGTALYSAGRKVEAQAPLREAWEGRRVVLGEAHLRTLASAHNFGVLEMDLRRFDEALPLLQAAWEGRLQRLGPSHPRTLASAAKLATLLQQQRDPEAVVVLRSLWEGFTLELGGAHPKAVIAARRLATWLVRHSFFEEAEAVLHHALAEAQAVPPEEEGEEQATMLRNALLDPGFTPDTWRELLASTARRPSAVDVLSGDLEDLQRCQAALAADTNQQEASASQEATEAKQLQCSSATEAIGPLFLPKAEQAAETRQVAAADAASGAAPEAHQGTRQLDSCSEGLPPSKYRRLDLGQVERSDT